MYGKARLKDTSLQLWQLLQYPSGGGQTVLSGPQKHIITPNPFSATCTIFCLLLLQHDTTYNHTLKSSWQNNQFKKPTTQKT